MGLRDSYRDLFWSIILIASLFIGDAFAEALQRHSPCLDTAYELQMQKFKREKKFIAKEAELKLLMPAACRTFRYEISLRKGDSFRVAMEWHDEVWGVNEKNDVTKLIGAKSLKTPPPSAAAPAPGQGPFVAQSEPHIKVNEPAMKKAIIAEPLKVLPVVTPRQEKKPAAMAVLASPIAAPAPSDYIFSLQSVDAPLTPSEKLDNCFGKAKFRSKSCQDTFEDLDKRCKREAKPSDLCNQFAKAVDSTDLNVCGTAESNFGKCELRRQRLEKKCDNALAQLSNECRMLKLYLAAFVPDVSDMAAAPTESPGRRAPASSCDKGDRQLCVSSYCSRATNAGATKEDLTRCAEAQGLQSGRASTRYLENAASMESSLNTLNRLRPVKYQWKESRLNDLGFVAEEVQSVDPLLVTYNEQGQIQGVKYAQLTALLTGGIQELFGRCDATSVRQVEIARRIDMVESINMQLIHENILLKKRLDQQAKDLDQIKAKMGLN
ncbi:MAG: tail fiber domain-containing protein [Bdellovibrionales bacterium]